MELWIGLIIGLLVGAIAAALIMRSIMRPKVDAVVAATEAELAEKRLVAEREVETILRTSREEAQEIRNEAEKAIERRYQDLARAEERVDRRSANQDSQASKLELREQVLNKRQSKLDKRQNELADLETIHRQKLEEIAAMTTDVARVVLLEQVGGFVCEEPVEPQSVVRSQPVTCSLAVEVHENLVRQSAALARDAAALLSFVVHRHIKLRLERQWTIDRSEILYRLRKRSIKMLPESHWQARIDDRDEAIGIHRSKSPYEDVGAFVAADEPVALRRTAPVDSDNRTACIDDDWQSIWLLAGSRHAGVELARMDKSAALAERRERCIAFRQRAVIDRDLEGDPTERPTIVSLDTFTGAFGHPSEGAV